ncbi:MAG: sigma-70 family RNA polymerase sigma factor, partial [Oscillospiraceae bacterium]|nr:sigma-70 family RNA polymerase sigma factor [Oscillospiraceae bacterium]
NILGNDRDAEECENDVYLAAWNTIPPQRPDPLRTYLCRIARNQALKRRQANAAGKRGGGYDAALEELAEVLPAREDVESRLGASALAEAINAFLDTLPYEDRFAFMRRYWYGDGPGEIAEMMHTGSHRVSVRLSRTRKKLQVYLKKEGYL